MDPLAAQCELRASWSEALSRPRRRTTASSGRRPHARHPAGHVVKIQLLYFAGCPHVDGAREDLRSAMAACAVTDVAVEEVDVEAVTTPPALREWGSPTVLIDGADVAGEGPSGLSCRLYSGVSGTPPRHLIEGRIRQATRGSR